MELGSLRTLIYVHPHQKGRCNQEGAIILCI